MENLLESKTLDSLAGCPLMTGIDREGLTAMIACLQPELRCYRPKECIALAEQPLSGIGILLAGSASIFKDNAAGDHVLLAMLEPGEIFGEMAAFSPRSVWPATVTAVTACAALFIPARVFTGSCGNGCTAHRKMNENLLRVISGKALALNSRVGYLSMKSIRQKVCSFLLDHAELHNQSGQITLSMSRQQTADYLNIPRPSLSRELCALRDEGLIDFKQNRIRLLNADGMKHYIYR